VPHVCARFGPGGQLIKVIPNLPSEGQPALVEIHSMETLLQHMPEQKELRSFPGPLGKYVPVQQPTSSSPRRLCGGGRCA